MRGHRVPKFNCSDKEGISKVVLLVFDNEIIVVYIIVS